MTPKTPPAEPGGVRAAHAQDDRGGGTLISRAYALALSNSVFMFII